MNSDSFVPDDPEGIEWDVVVIGTGMGGGTIGHALSKLGRRVLFVEKGHFLFGDWDRGAGLLSGAPDESPEGRLSRGWWPEPIQGSTDAGETEFFAPLGCGSGGTTGLYAAQLERLAPSDFKPRSAHPNVSDSTLPEAWPISYEDLVPYYRAAEELYRVRGTRDPLDPDPSDELREPPALSPRDQDLFDSFEELGLHPYRPHVGYEFVEGCGECGGSLCPNDCKNDAGRICVLPALKEHGASLLPNCEVLDIEADDKSVRSVRCKRGGVELKIKARVVVLAAGAFMTPVLMLNSRSENWPDGLANSSGLVGRNLMVHAGDFVAVRPRAPNSEEGPKKAIALNDFYSVDGHKLGTFQSVGISVEYHYVLHYLRSVVRRKGKWWRKPVDPFLRIAAFVGAWYYRSSTIFATILEDLPFHENRVIADKDAKNGMRFEYRYPDELHERNLLFRKRLADALRPNHKVVTITGDKTLNYGHVCGTVRFGEDPEKSVLNENNRAHDLSNLYVVDGSFFPSSGGTNTSLTVAANALRVAESIHEEL